MELITYPFALVAGAVYVLWCMLPFLMMAYFSVVGWCKWLTDGKFKLKTKADEFDEYFRLYSTPDAHFALAYVVPIILTVVSTVVLLARTFDSNVTSSGSFLNNLITVFYEFPVSVIVWSSSLTLPLALIFLASFGMRKLFRTGYSISDRLKKVEESN